MWPMKTATMRDLKHNLRQVTRWLDTGQEVQLTRRGKPFARVVPDTGAPKFRRPDFAAGLREVWGDAPPLSAKQTRDFWRDFRDER